MILAGDIGGTKTHLASFDVQGGNLVIVAEATYPSRDHSSLEEIAGAFLSRLPTRPERACFGVAGPVREGRVRTTNLPWVVDGAHLAMALGIPRVLVINDLEAMAYGVLVVPRKELLVLNEGVAGATGNAAVIAAGTGLGEAGLFWDGREHRPFACEGGHSDFAPRTDLEADLLAHLVRTFGHASWERVLSGPGLRNIYQFLAEREPGTANPSVATETERPDPAAVISQAALEKRCPVCEQALDLFVSLYGAEAGNLALKVMATGGVYVGGGIATKIRAKLAEGGFLESFLAKGRMRKLMESIPVRVILTERVSLLGAALLGAGHGARRSKPTDA
ncbi:MAG: glucokinase [Planctomycetota bacterium]